MDINNLDICYKIKASIFNYPGSQPCIQRSSLGQRENDWLRNVIASLRLVDLNIFINDMWQKYAGDIHVGRPFKITR